jgi:rubrerythrin
MSSKKPTEVCPVCGSTDLYYEAGGYTGKVYHCKNCGYIGVLIVEADEEMAKAIREDYEHKKGNE